MTLALNRLNRKLRSLMRALIRGALFSFGFHWVTVKGRKASDEEAPVLVCAPHSSMFDVLAGFVASIPTGISRAENSTVPIFGTVTVFSQPILVSREDPNSRQNTIKEIQRRAQSGGKWPQIMVFPEGTCTNRTCLISFKPGGFYPGVPVQPVIIRYKNELDTFTWTWEGPGTLTLLWWSLCQFNNQMEIEYLPVYTPGEEEKTNARLFASNVRRIMARELGVPITDHTYEDIRLMNYATKLDLPAASGLVEFSKLSKKLGMNFNNLQSLLDDFCQMAQKSQGHVDIDQFAAYLKVPVSEPLNQMFQLYDRDGSGTIDFREYVIGLSLVSMPANTEETLRVAFQAFDQGGKGYITEGELSEILENAFGMSHIDVHHLFEQVDADKDGRIIFEEFKAYGEKKPEYAKLFTTYQEQITALSDDSQNSEAKPETSTDDFEYAYCGFSLRRHILCWGNCMCCGEYRVIPHKIHPL